MKSIALAGRQRIRSHEVSAKYIKGAIGILVLAVLWQLGALYVRKVNPAGANSVLPTIQYVFFTSLPELASFEGSESGFGQKSYAVAALVLGKHSLITGARVVAGTALGMLVGVGMGMLMAWNSTVHRYVHPVVSFIRPIPLLVLIPLFLLWFGGREIGNLVFIVFGISMIMVVNTLNAIKNVPPYYGLFAETLGATRSQVFRTVILPAVIPEVMGGVRVALGLAWAITLGAELLAAQSGLGRILMLSQYFLYAGRMIIIVLLFTTYSYVMDVSATRIAKVVTRWKP